MKSVKNVISKYGLLLACGLTFILFLAHNNHVFRTDFSPEIENYQTKFRQKIDDLDRFLAYKKRHFSEENISILNRKDLEENSFFLHIYRNDSLLFWNTNQLPISRFSDIHFPSEGIVHLQNGWYYAKILRVKNCQLVASFLIKKDYLLELYSVEGFINGNICHYFSYWMVLIFKRT